MKLLVAGKKVSLFALSGAVALLLAGCLIPKPKITPDAGSYDCPQSVTITDSNALAIIYYTADGSAPTTASTKYDGPFPINSSATIQAIAVAPGPGAHPSKIVSSAYKCSAPSFTRADFAVLLQRTFNLSQPANPPVFPDVVPTDSYYGAVEAVAPFMHTQLLCPGCQLNKNFFPAQPVLQAVSTVTIMSILSESGKIQLLNARDSDAVLASVSDAKTLPLPARPYFATAIKHGMISLGEGNSIQAARVHTRREMVTLLIKVQKDFAIVGSVPE
ncbi:MAG: chitobiase/beta-hexosaminidase C-terminal domain-containing protein [Candidatus Acidiferrales bacterium]